MTATPDSGRLLRALLTFAIWTAVTLFGMRWASDGAKKPLVDTVTHGVSWNLVMALAVLAVATIIWRWRDLKFVAPKHPGSVILLWLPAAYLSLFVALALYQGLPPASTMIFLALNTMLVGLSEEWMFRGVIFQGLRSRFNMWPAIILTCLIFGSVHVLNVFTTGEFGEAVLQASTAACSGLLFVALLIRTGSIWVPIVLHAVWDFCTFLISTGAMKNGETNEPASGIMLLVPLLMVMPNLLYGLYLLRNVRNDTRIATD